MAEQNERASLEQKYMDLYDLDPNFQGHQDDIKEMRKMDVDTLKTRIMEAQKFYDYMADCWNRKNFLIKGTELFRS